MIGAYVTDIMVCNLGMPLVVGILVGTIFTGFVGLLMDRLIIKGYMTDHLTRLWQPGDSVLP